MFIIPFGSFNSNMLLVLKIMNFENVFWLKVIDLLDGKKYWWLKHIVWEQNIVKNHLYLSHNCKLDFKKWKK
jgi:hypothetical protein